jgi:hypothetical protein
MIYRLTDKSKSEMLYQKKKYIEELSWQTCSMNNVSMLVQQRLDLLQSMLQMPKDLNNVIQ